jgi:hypothetical protein
MAIRPRLIDPIERCLSCESFVYKQADGQIPGKEAPDLDLIVTICGHVFDRACLMTWLQTGSTCPLFPEENAKITLKECHDLKDSMTFLCKHYDKNQAIASEVLKEVADKICSICHDTFSSAYYLPTEKRFMHKTCWLKKNPTQSGNSPPEFHPQQLANFEMKIRPTLPVEVTPPTFSNTGLFVLSAIWVPISAWAWGMNWRYHQRNNLFLFVLSLPTLVTINTCFLLYRNLRSVFTENPV